MSKLSDKSSKRSEMSTAEQARALVIAAAGPHGLGDGGVKAAIARASQRLGIGFRRARAIYHREARLIGADEWEKIKRCAAQHNIKAEWGYADHAALEIRVREASPLPRRGTDAVRRDGAPAGEEGRGAGADAVARSAE